MDFTARAPPAGAQDAARALVDDSRLLRTQAPAADLTPTAGILGCTRRSRRRPLSIERGPGRAAALPVRSSTPAADAVTHFARAMGAVRGNAAARPDGALDVLRDTLTPSTVLGQQVEIQRLAATAWMASRAVPPRRSD